MSWRYNISVVTGWMRRWLLLPICLAFGHQTTYAMYVPTIEGSWWLECRRCGRGHFRGDARERTYR